MRIEGEDGQRALGGLLPGSVPDRNKPDDYLNDTLQSEMNAVQTKLTERWKMIQGQAKNLGPQKTSAMLQQLEMAARNKVIELKAGVQQRTDMMNRIRTLQKQGALSGAADFTASGSVDKMIWQVAAGPEIAEGMFPKTKPPESPEPVDTLKEYGQASQQANRVESSLEDYRIGPDQRESRWYLPAVMEKKTPGPVQVFDPQATETVKGKVYTGAWKDAPDQGKAAREMSSLRGELNVMNDAMGRIRQGETSGIKNLGALRNLSGRMQTGQASIGTIGDKIRASVLLNKINRGQVTSKKESARPNVRVKHLASGQTGMVPADEFNEQEYERLQ